MTETAPSPSRTPGGVLRNGGPAVTAVVIPAEQWRTLARAHRARIAEKTDPLVALHMRGERHPVQDFLFGYYSHSPAALQRWHPGAGVVLADDAEGSAAAAERLAWAERSIASSCWDNGVSFPPPVSAPNIHADNRAITTTAAALVAAMMCQRRRRVCASVGVGGAAGAVASPAASSWAECPWAESPGAASPWAA